MFHDRSSLTKRIKWLKVKDVDVMVKTIDLYFKIFIFAGQKITITFTNNVGSEKESSYSFNYRGTQI